MSNLRLRVLAPPEFHPFADMLPKRAGRRQYFFFPGIYAVEDCAFRISLTVPSRHPSFEITLDVHDAIETWFPSSPIILVR